MVGRTATSPHRRCVDTVRPLARALGIELECRDALAPDASGESGLASSRSSRPTPSLCTSIARSSERLFGGDVQCEKGGAWVLERVDDHWRPATYPVPPSPQSRRRRAALV